MQAVIQNQTGEQEPKNGTYLFIDGKEVPELANVYFSHRAGSQLTILGAELFAHGGFVVELNAEINVTIDVLPGFKLESATDAISGKTTYRAVPE